MTFTRTYSRTAYMALCGLFAALTAVCSYISIPLGFTPVPVNLATLAVFLAGGLLGRKYGTIALAVYALLGAVGVPVFSGFRGGLSVLAGPTGGYIIGYIVAAFLIGLLIETTLAKPSLVGSTSGSGSFGSPASSETSSGSVPNGSAVSSETPSGSVPSGAHAKAGPSRLRELILCAIAMIIGLAACYLLGTLWFMISTHTGVRAALVSCVFPFLIGDALKIAAGALLVQRLRHLL